MKQEIDERKAGPVAGVYGERLWGCDTSARSVQLLRRPYENFEDCIPWFCLIYCVYI